MKLSSLALTAAATIIVALTSSSSSSSTAPQSVSACPKSAYDADWHPPPSVTPFVKSHAGGSVIQLPRGKSILLRLDSNMSTGYSWQLAGLDQTTDAFAGGALRLNKCTYVKSADSQQIGGGGIEYWSIQAMSNANLGQIHLPLKYAHAWETQTYATSEHAAKPDVDYTINIVEAASPATATSTAAASANSVDHVEPHSSGESEEAEEEEDENQAIDSIDEAESVEQETDEPATADADEDSVEERDSEDAEDDDDDDSVEDGDAVSVEEAEDEDEDEDSESDNNPFDPVVPATPAADKDVEQRSAADEAEAEDDESNDDDNSNDDDDDSSNSDL